MTLTPSSGSSVMASWSSLVACSAEASRVSRTPGFVRSAGLVPSGAEGGRFWRLDVLGPS
jgi:hypothetical protein